MVDYYINYTSTHALSEDDESVQTRVAGGNFRYNILPHLPTDRTAPILDVACGYGRYLKALTDHDYTDAVGIDLSAEQITYARDRLHLANALHGDGLKYLREHPATFDAVLMLDVLEHLPTDDTIEWLQTGAIALREGGVLVIQVPNSLSPLSVHFHGDLTHQRAYSPATMSQSLRLAGFQRFEHYASFDSPDRLVGLFRMLLWRFVLNPTLRLLAKIAYGTSAGGIYTANLLTIAHTGKKS